jgi:hypothetical protein
MRACCSFLATATPSRRRRGCSAPAPGSTNASASTASSVATRRPTACRRARVYSGSRAFGPSTAASASATWTALKRRSRTCARSPTMSRSSPRTSTRPRGTSQLGNFPQAFTHVELINRRGPDARGGEGPAPRAAGPYPGGDVGAARLTSRRAPVGLRGDDRADDPDDGRPGFAHGSRVHTGYDGDGEPRRIRWSAS